MTLTHWIMKNHLVRLLSVVCLLLAGSLYAQEAIKFEKTTHEFGELQQGDDATYTFRFTNTSAEPVKLTNVRASCGCTTPTWTREAVAPGATGEILVKYSTVNRPGPFTKTVSVTYDSVARPIVLYIKGNVAGAPQAPVQNFVHSQGSLAFEQINQNVGILDSDKERSVSFRVRNAGPLPVTITKTDADAALEIIMQQQQLIPGQVATIDVKVKGQLFTQNGPFSLPITLQTDDAQQPEKTLTITGNLNRVYSAEELARMPNIQFETLEYDAGTVLAGEKVDFTFRFTNTGQDDLIIEAVQASCGCTATSPKDKVIAGGGSSEIVATFDSRGRKGVQNKSITVRSNDPDQGTVVLRLKVTVEEDPFHQGGLGPATGGSY
ncbi:MAG: hypothetical protein OHK0039_07330 [Bacteroidia bacterium]